MSLCCVSGCNNRQSKSEFKFFRIPSGTRPSQAHRRRLWQRAIRQANKKNNNNFELTSNASVCGAHFISGEASSDCDDVDYIPTVFKCIKRPKKKGSFMSTFYGRRRRRHHKNNAAIKEIQTPTDSDDDQMSVSVKTDEFEAPATPSGAQGEETFTEMTEAEKGGKTVASQTAVSAFSPSSDQMNPVVLLKRLVLQADEYRVQLCKQDLGPEPQLVKEEQLDEEGTSVLCQTCGKLYQSSLTQHQCAKLEEPSFPCNMCDRSFLSSHGLKRHKLLHVKDDRKCKKCGVIFCRRHSHIPFQPATDFKEESSADKLQTEDGDAVPENVAQESDRSSACGEDRNAQGALTETPLLAATTTVPTPHVITTVPTPITTVTTPTHEFPHPAPRKQAKKVKKAPPPAAPWPPSNPDTSLEVVQPPKMPSSLKMFSPQFLTSALLHVERNYDYILSKSKEVTVDIKEEPVELPVEEIVEQVTYERIAYDVEVEL